MGKNGYENPIWVGDASSVTTLHFGPITTHPNPFSNDPRGIVTILANKQDNRYNKVNAWYRAEQSRLTVKKSVGAIEMGLEKINIGGLAEPTQVNKLVKWASHSPVAYNWAIGHFLDKNYLPYPAYYTYKFTAGKLANAMGGS